jgi:hypothetical protein
VEESEKPRVGAVGSSYLMESPSFLCFISELNMSFFFMKQELISNYKELLCKF